MMSRTSCQRSIAFTGEKKGRWVCLLLLAARYVIVCACESTKTTTGAPVDVAQHRRCDFLTTPKPEQVAEKRRHAQFSLNADEGGGHIGPQTPGSSDFLTL